MRLRRRSWAASRASWIPQNYAEVFGFQWRTWRTLSDSTHRGRGKFEEILERTHFGAYPTRGATLLECGMGGGDDTEVLLQLGFSELHAFDLSNAVAIESEGFTIEHLFDPPVTPLYCTAVKRRRASASASAAHALPASATPSPSPTSDR